MITLYGRPTTASLAPRICLEEIGADYRFVESNADPGRPGPPDFVDASPHLLVPALRDGDLTLTESAAIVMHLADRHPEAGLAPLVGSSDRANWYRWLVYSTNTIGATMYHWFYPERYTTDPAASESIKAAAEQRVAAAFDWVEGELEGRDYLVGDRFTGADAFMWMLCRWSRNHDRPAFSRPNLGAYWERIRARPAVVRVRQLEDLG